MNLQSCEGRYEQKLQFTVQFQVFTSIVVIRHCERQKPTHTEHSQNTLVYNNSVRELLLSHLEVKKLRLQG